MDTELMEKARVGLQAWQDGDLSALEELLDPDVELLWWEAGDWNCHSRDDVLRVLAQRQREGVNRAQVELIDAGEDVLVSVSHTVYRPDWPDEPATVIRFRGGKAIEMRQFKSREEALTAASSQS
ncbi:MAG: nuclear transport factor 2 family protein [Gaiellaceae bacterium]